MKNPAASIRERLLIRMLTLYKQEALLHRVVTTSFGDSVVLKGGLLFFQLQGIVARPTKDIDLLGFDEDRKETLLKEVLEAVTTVQIEDGLTFDPSSIETAPIAGRTAGGGIRGHIIGCLGSARTRLQVDMGFGDVVTGGPVQRPYRTLLQNRSFEIQTYSEEAMAAEKFESIVSLGIINSRYKDLFDLYAILMDAKVSEGNVIEAAVNTFRRRQTFLPVYPQSLSPAHWESRSFGVDWNRFLGRIGADRPELSMLSSELRPRLERIYSIVRSRILEE